MYEERIRMLRLVPYRLREAGLRVEPKKYNLFQRMVEFFGHVMSDQWRRVNESKAVEAVRSWPVP